MPEIKQIIRVLSTDLDGTKPLYISLTKIKGIGFNFSNAICNFLNLEKVKKAGSLSQEEVKKIESLLTDPKALPSWLFNRKKDYDTGDDLHITTSKLKLMQEFDLKRLKKIKSYRGLRHAWGLPVRGQRTRSHFRKGKSVGVQKKKIKQQTKKSGDKSRGKDKK